MITGVKWCLWSVLVAVGTGARAERWQWPEPTAAGRVDSMVRFSDGDKSVKPTESRFYLEEVAVDHAPFREPTDTEGFYNRPPGDGRYRVQHGSSERRKGERQLTPDGTLDSLQYCKCVSTPNCQFKMNSNACGANQHLCCYMGAAAQHPTSEYFNELEQDPPTVHPAHQNHNGPFPPPPVPIGQAGYGPGQSHNNLLTPTGYRPGPSTGPNKQILLGPGGLTGIIGPNKPIFEGPEGPAGIKNTNRPVLVGPGGPTGVIGPTHEKRKKNYLSESADLGANESAQRGVLVGPGGPTGIIGPAYNNRPILVGPGGPTGIIGPRGQFPQYRGGVLVGPGGPTGSIGPRRGILSGPGGPTGRIGPWGYGK